MKTVVFAFAIALSCISCNAQSNKENQEPDGSISKAKPDVQEPLGTWTVNKKLDENGNLIRYDSIYTYSYGNINGNKLAPHEIDSAMTAFRKYMMERMPSSFEGNVMEEPFAVDSLRNNFFERGVFENHWEDFFPEMGDQLKRMDSLHQQFFNNTQKGLFPSEGEYKKSSEQNKI